MYLGACFPIIGLLVRAMYQPRAWGDQTGFMAKWAFLLQGPWCEQQQPLFSAPRVLQDWHWFKEIPPSSSHILFQAHRKAWGKIMAFLLISKEVLRVHEIQGTISKSLSGCIPP